MSVSPASEAERAAQTIRGALWHGQGLGGHNNYRAAEDALGALLAENAALEARLAEIRPLRERLEAAQRERDEALKLGGWASANRVAIVADQNERRAEAAEARVRELEEAVASAMTSLATGPMKDGYAYSILAATDRKGTT